MQKVYVFPDVAPKIESIKISIDELPTLDHLMRGHFIIEQKKTGKKKSFEISGNSNLMVIEFNQMDGNLEGDYYITIEADTIVTLRFGVKIYSTINDNLEEISNIRIASSGNVIFLNIVNDTYHNGYYIFYAKNAPGEIVTINPNPTSTLQSAFFRASTGSWPSSGMETIHGSVLRLPMDGNK